MTTVAAHAEPQPEPEPTRPRITPAEAEHLGRAAHAAGRPAAPALDAAQPRADPLPALAMMGTWWDHPPLPTPGFVGHTVSHLDPSPDLRAQLAEQTRRHAGHVQPPLPITLTRGDAPR